MDKLDLILLKAWDRISAAVRADRVRALKRSRRQHKGVLTRPMREWCLVIRASDTRINEGVAYIEPSGAIHAHEEHEVELTGSLIRELTKPITIDWPGVPYREAARILGREYKTIKTWVRRSKAFQIDYFHGPGFIKRKQPIVWTPSPIDPNNFQGRVPHPMWGTLWQHLWKDLPEEHVLTVVRVPKWRRRRGKVCFAGWDFICPGRLDERGEYHGCGRRSTYLYGPQTVRTLAHAIGEVGFEMPEGSGLAGQWFPGIGDPIASKGPRSFACKECWSVRSACMANYNGWNEFIATISGGLLYGRDVPRPEDICPVVRKKAEYQWRRTIQRREDQSLSEHESRRAEGT